MEDTTNNLRWGEGSGMRIASKWQLGVFVECMSRRSGCVDSASEWCLVVILNDVLDGWGCIFDEISGMGVLGGTPSVPRR